jgi:hypothetical protein
MLMTVVDEQGCVQYYFLPNSQPAAPDASGEQDAASLQQQQLQQDEQQQGDEPGQAQTYALRSRAHKSHSPVNDHMQVDASTAANLEEQPQHDESGLRMATRHYQPQQQQQQQQQQPVFTTPAKERPADEDHAVPATAAAVRSLRSSSTAGGSDGVGGSSCRTTPPKRATPVKRKADAEVRCDGCAGSCTLCTTQL